MENSGNRYSRKRNSYDAIKNSFSLKNAKKSLPEVCIDLNQHNRKSKLLTHTKMVKMKEPQVSYFDEKRKMKPAKKKEQLTLNNMYQTQGHRTQNENKNVLNEYRDEIQELKMQNETLRTQNEKLRINEKYMNHKVKDFSQNNQENQQRKEYVIFLERKVDKYSEKIKKLYEQLINQKRKYGDNKIVKRQTMTKSTAKDHYQRQHEIYSYRMDNNKQDRPYKKMTSPSSEIDHIQWTQEIEPLMIYQRKGQEAYYRARGGYYGAYNSEAS